MRGSGLVLFWWPGEKAEQGCRPPALEEIPSCRLAVPCHVPRPLSGVIHHPSPQPIPQFLLFKIQELGDWLDFIVTESGRQWRGGREKTCYLFTLECEFVSPDRSPVPSAEVSK